MRSTHEGPPETRPSHAGATIHDSRPTPPGVLPRQLQMWVMVGIAVVILTIILLTGQPDPGPAPDGVPSLGTPASIQPDRVRDYQQRVTDQEARLRRDLAETAPEPVVADAGPVPADPLAAERQRREYESLFADHVALSRRPPADPPYVVPGPSDPLAAMSAVGGDPRLVASPTREELAALRYIAEEAWPDPSADLAPLPRPTPVMAGTVPSQPGDPPNDLAATGDTGPISADGPVHRLLEGTVIEAVLVNRLDGTFAGPVQCVVTTPVYAHGRQHVLIPAGSRVLGSASPVETWGDARLAVRFHRLILPDGRTHPLTQFQGLNQIGETGLRDRVDRHYWQVFGASLAIGAIAGLAQFNTRSGVDGYSAGDGARQAAGASLAASTGRVLDRYLNVLPTVTIREGHRIKIYLTNDLNLPAYAAVTPMAAGGTR